MKLGAVLLGAGNARRYGKNKLMAEVDGAPMGFHALDLLSKIDFAQRVYVTQPDYDELFHEAKRLNYLVAMNRDASRGVASSIAIGLQVLVMQGGFLDDGVLFAVSDQPYLTEKSVQKLIHAFKQDKTRICALSFGGKQGNPVIFPQELVTSLMRLKGDVGGRQVIEANRERLTLVEAANERELMDIDEKK